MTFEYPTVWFLLLLLALPWLIWRLWAARGRGAAKFSSVEIAGSLHKTLPVRLRWLTPAMRIAAIGLLILAWAGPMEGLEKTRLFSEGIAIEMLIDRSGSMRAMDFSIDGKRLDRLSAVKAVAEKFIEGDGKTLPGRGGDMIGLIAFARYADNISPATLGHEYLVSKLKQLKVVETRQEDGTAIGDAIGLAVERLRTLKIRGDSATEGKKHSLKSKVMILLTDGRNNAGDLDPVKAAELARAMGVKIYTIGVGSAGPAPYPVVDPFTGQTMLRRVRIDIDEKTLERIAKITGGRYFRATDTDSLRNIYATIDKLEKTKIQDRRFAEYRHWAVKSVQIGPITAPPLLLMAMVLLLGEGVLANTWLRRIP
ncbi:MAG: aerotolerance regulator BatA [Planctomycetota bacterium]|nr:MAG: aerotolerance regulator BatA [Planctomycetota bacterium]